MWVLEMDFPMAFNYAYLWCHFSFHFKIEWFLIWIRAKEHQFISLHNSARNSFLNMTSNQRYVWWHLCYEMYYMHWYLLLMNMKYRQRNCIIICETRIISLSIIIYLRSTHFLRKTKYLYPRLDHVQENCI